MSAPLVPVSISTAVEQRRSKRALEAKSPVPDKVIVELAEHAILHVPSAFNNQAARVTVLFGENHKKLWAITGKTLLNKIGEERYKDGTEQKMTAFANGYGTILFWDDACVAKALNEHAPNMYKDKTDEWVQQSQGMHQYYLWTALDALGLGASLQHYNPLIDEEVQKTWNISSDWKLRAQMVFGTPKEGSELPAKEQKVPLEQRVQAFGAKI
jgi:predicted oxidoreductase (fatty acid repression mutant protein)